MELTFGRDFEQGSGVKRPAAIINMSPQLAKVLVLQLGTLIAEYEQAVGQLPIPSADGAAS